MVKTEWKEKTWKNLTAEGNFIVTDGKYHSHRIAHPNLRLQQTDGAECSGALIYRK
jgi:hypothetical protein